jgi:putative membrane protein
MDAERIMMQTVQTSLSLIGFGFTITEFFSGDAVRGAFAPSPHENARLLGEALLILGLLLLTMGIWNQANYRRRLGRLMQRTVGRPLRGNTLRYRETPSFLIAVLLLVVGLVALIRRPGSTHRLRPHEPDALRQAAE